MKILFRAVNIVDKASDYHGQRLDLMIEDGVISRIGERLEDAGAEVYDVPGLHVSPGWIDMRTALRDPGMEHEEDFDSLKETAQRGGFTGVVLLPNTRPVVDSKGVLNYIHQAGKEGAVAFYPTAAVTIHAEGVDFSEMIDLHHAGAAAFTDGEHAIQNSDILLKALLYLQPLNALLMNRPEDRYLSMFGQMHEGITSTLLGLKGVPPLAEEMMILRDLQLLEYALSNRPGIPVNRPLLHIPLLSTQKSVSLLRDAKAKGLPVSCDVAAHQMAYEDTALQGFDTYLKVSPPFRSAADIAALKEGLADGTIDVIVSDHTPQAEESKDREFDLASFGITALETVFPLGRMYSGLQTEDLVEKLTSIPRRILRQEPVVITGGNPANLTFFEPDTEWVFKTSYSKSGNTPFLRRQLQGRVRGVCNRGVFRWFQEES